MMRPKKEPATGANPSAGETKQPNSWEQLTGLTDSSKSQWEYVLLPIPFCGDGAHAKLPDGSEFFRYTGTKVEALVRRNRYLAKRVRKAEAGCAELSLNHPGRPAKYRAKVGDRTWILVRRGRLYAAATETFLTMVWPAVGMARDMVEEEFNAMGFHSPPGFKPSAKVTMLQMWGELP